MDIMSQTLKECMDDENEDQVNTKPADTPVEDKPVEEPKPADDPKPEEDQPGDKPEDKPEDTPSDDKPKQPKDTSQFTKEEKAEFAFKRQLARQRERHAQEIEDIKNTFQKQFDDFKATMTKKEPEPQKVRTDFETDDDYIAYLVKQGMDRERESMKAEQDKADQERAELEREQAEVNERQRMVAETFQANCRDAIDPDDMADFQSKVQLASSNGLAELLDKAPAVRDYIFTCKRGPKLLHAMLRDRDTFASVMRTAAVSVNPMMTTIELDSMASSLPAKYSQPDPEPEQQRTMPHLGKPGAGGPSGNDSKDITNDDAELIKFMRSRR